MPIFTENTNRLKIALSKNLENLSVDRFSNTPRGKKSPIQKGLIKNNHEQK